MRAAYTLSELRERRDLARRRERWVAIVLLLVALVLALGTVYEPPTKAGATGAAQGRAPSPDITHK